MPENEALFANPRTANRWHRLRDRIGAGESLDCVFPDLQVQVYTALRRVFKEWVDRNVTPEALFRAAMNDPNLLRTLVEKTCNSEYAQLLRDAVSGEKNPTLETVLLSFLNSAWEHIRSHLQLDCREGDILDAFMSNVDQMLARLLNALKENPNKIPRRPPRKDPPPDLGDTLGESLPLA